MQVARAESELKTADRVLGVAQDLQGNLAAPLRHLQQQLQRAERELLVRIFKLQKLYCFGDTFVAPNHTQNNTAAL
jgi:hypothetical protein